MGDVCIPMFKATHIQSASHGQCSQMHRSPTTAVPSLGLPAAVLHHMGMHSTPITLSRALTDFLPKPVLRVLSLLNLAKAADVFASPPACSRPDPPPVEGGVPDIGAACGGGNRLLIGMHRRQLERVETTAAGLSTEQQGCLSRREVFCDWACG